MNTEGLSSYYNQISKLPLLTLEEEESLVNIIYNSESSEAAKKRAKDKLVTSNLRFVFKEARRRSKKNATLFEELVSLGNLGLLKALDKYEPSRGVRFLSYAGWWVMQHQLKGQANERLVALPLWKQQLAQLIAKQVDEKGEPLTKEELMNLFPNYNIKDLQDLQSTQYLTRYLDDFPDYAYATEELEESILDMLEKEELEKGLNKLEEPDRSLLILFFGLGDSTKLTNSEIAKKLDMKPERVRRNISKAVKKLRNIIISGTYSQK